jgi:hypothetical protein
MARSIDRERMNFCTETREKTEQEQCGFEADGWSNPYRSHWGGKRAERIFYFAEQCSGLVGNHGPELASTSNSEGWKNVHVVFQ